MISLCLLGSLCHGCSPSPKAHQPSQIHFQSQTDLDWTTPLCLSAQPDTSRLTLVCGGGGKQPITARVSTDFGQTFGPPAALTLPRNMGLSSNRMDLLQGAHGCALIGEGTGPNSEIVSLLSSDGQNWEAGGRLEIHPARGVASFQSLDAGNSTMALVGPSEGLRFPLYLSLDEGQEWQEVQVDLPIPDGLSGLTIKPPGPFGTPAVLVDARDRIHWLVPEYRFSRADGKSATGCLSVRLDSKGAPLSAQLSEADYHSQVGALGENRSQPDQLYRVLAREAVSQEKSHINIPCQLEFSYSSDGGVHWSRPFVLDDHKGTKNSLRVAADGKLVVISWQDQRSADPGLYCSTSLDGGIAWSEPQRVGEQPEFLNNYQLLVEGQRILLAGSLRGPSSFQAAGAFLIRGEVMK